MLDKGRIMRTYGSEMVGKGLDEGFLYLDKYVPIGTGNAPHNRLSTYLNVIGAVALPIIGDQVKVSPDMQVSLEQIGGYWFTNVWDYVNEYIQQMGATRVPSPAGNQGVSVQNNMRQPYNNIPVQPNVRYQTT